MSPSDAAGIREPVGDADGSSVYRADVILNRSPDARPPQRTLNVGLAVPMHGPAGMFGLSCVACAVLAAEEVNDAGGLLGREIRLVPIDGAGSPDAVAGRVDRLLRAGRIDAVTGWHLSHVRRAIATRLEGRVPYVYSTLYEGGERSPGVFLTGETPDRQIAPAMAWLRREAGIRRWALVGDDYLWPRGSAAAVRGFVGALDVEITEHMFVPLGQEDFTDVLARLERSDAQAVLMLLVGQDAVHFNRAFAEAGLHERMFRLSPLMDENMLLASGPDATVGLYSAAGYFDTLATANALDLVGRYASRFGHDAPVLNSMGESCYEAIRLLASVTVSARSFDVGRLMGLARSPVGYDGPRGAVHLRDRHLIQDIYLARADGTVFDVVTQL